MLRLSFLFLPVSLCVMLVPRTLPAQPARLVDDAVGGRIFHVYLPEGYDSSDERYPLVLFFRGAHDEWLDRSEDASRRGNIITVIDDLVTKGSVGRSLFVFPDTPLPTAFPEDGYVTGTLLPYLDATYRTLPTRFARAIDGFSWGGLFTMAYLLRYPSTVISVGAYDPSVFALSYSDFETRRDSPGYLGWLRSLSLHVTSAALGGNNYAGTRELLDSLASYGLENSFDDLRLDPAAMHNWFYADLHASRTIPRHWQRMSTDPGNTQVTLSGALSGGSVSGTVPLSWSVTTQDPTVRVFVQRSSDRGTTWSDIGGGLTTDSTILWETSLGRDGAFTWLRAIAAGDTSFGKADVRYLRVDNPGNGRPEVFFDGLPAAQPLSGPFWVRWVGGDPEEDACTVYLSFSADGGQTWTGQSGPFALTDSLLWQTATFPNSRAVVIRIVASDGLDSTVVETRHLRVENARVSLPDASVERRGGGDGTVRVNIVDAVALTGHRYAVTFHRDATLRYDVTDLTRSAIVLQGIPVREPLEEGPVFDGIRLEVTDVAVPTFDPVHTGWVRGASNLSASLLVPEVLLLPDTVRGSAAPADYFLIISAVIGDTTISRLGAPSIPVNWSVWNATERRKVLVEFNEFDFNGQLSHADELYFWEVRTDGAATDTVLTWKAVLSSPIGLLSPQPGDTMVLAVRQPILDGDSFEFDAIVTGVAAFRSIPDGPTLEPLFPNPFNPTTNLLIDLPDRSDIEISVFNLLGQRITTIGEGTFRAGRHPFTWNAATYPSGLYIIRIHVTQAGVPGAHRTFQRKALLLK